MTDNGPTAKQWAALAEPFPTDQVERLPKQLRRGDQDKQTCSVARRGVCADDHPCGGYHARAIHLSYIGHAGVTMRLNSVDPTWTWEPMALTPQGLPAISDGMLWIKLTVLGVTRLGVGDAEGKNGPAATKEMIGDALRNAAMRFGVGTYLWSKSPAAQVIAAGGDPDTEHQDRPDEPAVPDERVELINEIARLAGDNRQAVVDEWASDHDGEHIKNATDLDALRLKRDELRAVSA